MDTVTDQELSGAKTIVPFQAHEEQARAIVAEAADLKVTDATQVTLIKRSKELRLKAKHTRCAVEISETIAQKLDDLLDWIRNKRDSL